MSRQFGITIAASIAARRSSTATASLYKDFRRARVSSRLEWKVSSILRLENSIFHARFAEAHALWLSRAFSACQVSLAASRLFHLFLNESNHRKSPPSCLMSSKVTWGLLSISFTKSVLAVLPRSLAMARDFSESTLGSPPVRTKLFTRRGVQWRTWLRRLSPLSFR